MAQWQSSSGPFINTPRGLIGKQWQSSSGPFINSAGQHVTTANIMLATATPGGGAEIAYDGYDIAEYSAITVRRNPTLTQGAHRRRESEADEVSSADSLFTSVASTSPISFPTAGAANGVAATQSFMLVMDKMTDTRSLLLNQAIEQLMKDVGITAEIQKILDRYANLTATEDAALRTFLTTLANADILGRVAEFWPLFLTDPTDSKTSGMGKVSTLVENGTPTHLPGTGWQSPNTTSYLSTVENIDTFGPSPTGFAGGIALFSTQAPIQFPYEYMGAKGDSSTGFGLEDRTGSQGMYLYYGGRLQATGAYSTTEPMCMWRAPGEADEFRVRIGEGAVAGGGGNQGGTRYGLPAYPFYFLAMNRQGTLQGQRTIQNFVVMFDVEGPVGTGDPITLTLNQAIKQLMVDVGVTP